MDLDTVISKLKYLSDEIDIKVEKFSSGHWINEYNNEWITNRIYISIKSGNKLPKEFLTKIVKRVNGKSIKSNIEVVEK